MKKTITLILFACLLVSVPAQAQWAKVTKELEKVAPPNRVKNIVTSLRGHNVNISAGAVMGQFFRKHTYSNYYTVSGTYTYRIPFERWFQFGGGIGVGYGRFMNLAEGDPAGYYKDNTFVMQVYGRAKFNASLQYKTPFALIDIGYAYAGLDKPYGGTDSYNALGFFFQPAIGYDFTTKWTHCISVMVGCNFALQKYYNTVDNETEIKVCGDRKLRSSMVLAVGYTF